MRTIFIDLSFAFIIAGPVFAQSTNDAYNKIAKAARNSVGTHKSNGISGVMSNVTKCYTKDGRNGDFYCLYLDLAGRHIDKIFSKEMNFPPQEFFADEQFLNRVGRLFVFKGMTLEQSNEYLRLSTLVVNKHVENQLQQKKR